MAGACPGTVALVFKVHEQPFFVREQPNSDHTYRWPTVDGGRAPMDPHLLRSFVAIARLGHLGRAAAELHLCKPALSTHLKELERRLEQVLFERTASGMRLTSAGTRLLPIANKALAALDDVCAVAKEISSRLSGRADLGTVADSIWLRSAQVVDLLHRHHPDLKVHLHQGLSGQVQRDVLEGRLAAGWMLGPADEPALTTRVLTSVRLRVVGPRAWAQKLKDATIEELADFPWVAAPDTCAYHRHRQFVFASLGRQPQDSCHADTERAMMGLVSEGLGLCLMREELAQAGQRDGNMAIWDGAVPDLHLRFVIPTLRRDEPIGRALMESAVRPWGQRLA